MNKKIKKSIIIILIIIGIFAMYKFWFNKVFEIKSNWNINLPFTGKEIYKSDNSGFHGDGYRYTILYYSKGFKTNDNMMKWSNSIEYKIDNVDFQENMNQIYRALKVPSKFKINLNNQMKYAVIKDKKDNMSWMILAYDQTEKKLFIVEGIY